MAIEVTTWLAIIGGINKAIDTLKGAKDLLPEGTLKDETEVNLAIAERDLKMADIQTYMQSPHGTPPFSQIGGFQAITLGESGWLNLDLTPGEYVALCHVPDPATGHAHTELGMVMPFSVK